LVASSRSEGATFKAQLDRLKEAIGATKDIELARALGVSASSVFGAKKRQSIPTDWIIEIANKYNVSSDWLIHGHPHMEGKPGLSLSGSEHGYKMNLELKNQETSQLNYESIVEEHARLGLFPVRKVEARLSAGSGSLEASSKPLGVYAFRSEWIQSKGSPSRMVLMDVAGDSLEPYIRDGDTVLIDRSQQNIIVGKLYAVSLGNEVFIKSLHRKPGKLVLRSYNTVYEPIDIDLHDESLDFRVIGRVVWHCGED